MQALDHTGFGNDTIRMQAPASAHCYSKTAGHRRTGAGSLTAVTRRLQTGRSGRAAIGAICLASSAPVLSGCFYLSPSQTTVSYNGGPGSNTTIGALKLSDVHVVTTRKGAPGQMQGLVANTSAVAVPLTIAIGGQTSQISIPADTALRLDGMRSGTSAKTIKGVTVAATPVQPGAKFTVNFTVPGGGQTPVLVPVLLSNQVYNR